MLISLMLLISNVINYTVLAPTREKCFSEENIINPCLVYNVLCPQYELVQVEYFCYESKRIMITGEEYITNQAQSEHSPAIILLHIGLVS